MSKLIFGCGYLGHRVARRWRDLGHEVFVVTRRAERAALLAQEGCAPIVADVGQPETLSNLPIADAVLFAIGFTRSSNRPVRLDYVSSMRSVLHALPRETSRIIYTSSTGVYGQWEGEWVDEDAPCRPGRETAKACLEAEQVLAAHPLGGRSVTLRLAGLYGPRRIPNFADVRCNKAIAAPEDGWINLIHVDDAVETVLAAETHAIMPRTYVVSDGHPVVRRDYFAELARLLGAPPPIFVSPSDDSTRSHRASTSKRVCNARMVAELDVKLRYPTYREGLAAIVAVEGNDSPERA